MAGRLTLASAYVIALAALFATPAAALDSQNDDACTRETMGHAQAAATVDTVAATLEAIFNAPAADVTTPEGTSDVPSLQMIMVRVKDGKPVMACVDSKEAANRFLTAPVEKIRGKVAEEK